MFFVKTNVNDATEINTEITDDNVYSYCPECGAEVPVLCFSEMIKDEDVDLYAIAVLSLKTKATTISSKKALLQATNKQEGDNNTALGGGYVNTNNIIPLFE